MDTKEEKLLRAVEERGMASVPALADATGLSRFEVTDWIEKAESKGTHGSALAWQVARAHAPPRDDKFVVCPAFSDELHEILMERKPSLNGVAADAAVR